VGFHHISLIDKYVVKGFVQPGEVLRADNEVWKKIWQVLRSEVSHQFPAQKASFVP
jgi:hypothetical protein